MGNRTRRISAIMIGCALPMLALGSANASLPKDSVGTPQLKDGAVKTPKLGFQAVDEQKLAGEAVTTQKLAPAAVRRGRLQDGAVNSPKVARGSLKGSDIDQLSLDFTILQRRIATICPPGSAIRAVARSGQVTCQRVGGDDWRLAGNRGTDPATDFIGTTDNAPLNLRVNDARALRLEPDPTSPNLIGGDDGNGVRDGASGATVSGGGHDGDPNRVTDDFGTVGGGEDNLAGDGAGLTSDRPDATVGGGVANIASGAEALVAGGTGNTASGLQATVGGGIGNRAIQRIATISGGSANSANGNGATIAGGAANSASGAQSAVAGGELNFANAEQAALGGGFSNTAGGRLATIPGGAFNQANGDFSFAAGRRAQANHGGAFVWADSTNGAIASTASDQFIARAGGHFFLTATNTLPEDQGLINTSAGANPDGTNGAYLSAGGVWTDVSDEHAKERITSIRPADVMRKVADLPVTTWSYRSEPGVRHLGPVAQDFHRAFGLGADARHIAALDTGGVALAAIKGLNSTVQKQGRQIARLRTRLAEVGGN